MGKFHQYYSSGPHKGRFALCFNDVDWCQKLLANDEYGFDKECVLLICA